MRGCVVKLTTKRMVKQAGLFIARKSRGEPENPLTCFHVNGSLVVMAIT